LDKPEKHEQLISRDEKRVNITKMHILCSVSVAAYQRTVTPDYKNFPISKGELVSTSMADPIRVLLLGTGQMGSGIARLVLDKPGFELVGVYARRGKRGGLDLAEVLGYGTELGIRIGNDLEATVLQSRPQIAIQATCSTLADAWDEIALLLRHGVNVISIAEEMAFPSVASAEAASAIHRLALDQGVAVLGTGVNPGFVLDTLVIVLTGVCSDIRSITAERVNDLTPYGPTVLRAQGVGLTPEAFEQGVAAGTVVGHIGFRQSIQMIGHAVGWSIDRVTETRASIVSSVSRETPFVRIRPGEVAGCLHKAVAYSGGRAVITLNHPQQIQPEREGVATGDSIEIQGTPTIRLSGSPEIPGGAGTIALTVNMIPKVLNAAPGLHAMADLPLPAALLADARDFLRKDRFHD